MNTKNTMRTEIQWKFLRHHYAVRVSKYQHDLIFCCFSRIEHEMFDIFFSVV